MGSFAKLLAGSFFTFFPGLQLHAQIYDPIPTPYYVARTQTGIRRISVLARSRFHCLRSAHGQGINVQTAFVSKATVTRVLRLEKVPVIQPWLLTEVASEPDPAGPIEFLIRSGGRTLVLCARRIPPARNWKACARNRKKLFFWKNGAHQRADLR